MSECMHGCLGEGMAAEVARGPRLLKQAPNQQSAKAGMRDPYRVRGGSRGAERQGRGGVGAGPGGEEAAARVPARCRRAWTAAPRLLALAALRHALLHGHRGHRQPVVRWHRRLHLPQPHGLRGLQREAPAGQALLQRLRARRGEEARLGTLWTRRGGRDRGRGRGRAPETRWGGRARAWGVSRTPSGRLGPKFGVGGFAE